MRERKNVNLVEAQRLDYNDLVPALTDLKDTDLAEHIRHALGVPDTGVVLFGFGGSPNPGTLEYAFADEDSAAIAPDGTLLTSRRGAPTTLTDIPPNKTVYIHAYLVEVETDPDSRWIVNRAEDPPREYPDTMNTRRLKAVAFYVKTTDESAPSLETFSRSEFIGGVERSLVPVVAFRTNATQILPSTILDARPKGVPNDQELEDWEASGKPGGGVKALLLDLANAIRGIKGFTPSHDRPWNDTPSATLREVEVARLGFHNLSQAIGAAYTHSTTLPSGSGSQQFVSSDTFIKSGNHRISDFTISSSGADTFRILGAGKTNTNLVNGEMNLSRRFVEFESIGFEGVLNIQPGSRGLLRFKDCRFGFRGASGTYQFNLKAPQKLRFENCVFDLHALFAQGVANIEGTEMEFFNCEFRNSDGFGFLLWDHNNFAEAGVSLRFHGCRFDGNGEGSLFHPFGIHGQMDLLFDGCKFLDVPTLVAFGNTIGHPGHGSLTMRGCEVTHSSTYTSTLQFIGAPRVGSGGLNLRFSDCNIETRGVLFRRDWQNFHSPPGSQGTNKVRVEINGGTYGARALGLEPFIRIDTHSELHANGATFLWGNPGGDSRGQVVSIASPGNTINGCVFDARWASHGKSAIALFCQESGARTGLIIEGAIFRRNGGNPPPPIHILKSATTRTGEALPQLFLKADTVVEFVDPNGSSGMSSTGQSYHGHSVSDSRLASLIADRTWERRANVAGAW